VSWIEVRAQFAKTPEDWAPLVDLFLQHGLENTMQVDMPPSIVACVVEVPGADAQIASLRSSLENAGAVSISVSPYEEQNWEEAWKKFFKPRRIGRNFIVRPTWEPFEGQRGDHVIVLDPGQAFGTGDHPTTRMCLALLEDADVTGHRVLDIGCGSGVLSIGAKLLGAREVVAIDIEPLAVEVTKENALVNGVELTAICGDGLSDISAQVEKPDVVLSNIISAALMRIASDVSRVIEPGGRWIVSGILSANWPDVKKSAEKNGFRLQTKLEEDDWVAATFLH
jgi:ribosomal protein L11 methyltransferase